MRFRWQCQEALTVVQNIPRWVLLPLLDYLIMFRELKTLTQIQTVIEQESLLGFRFSRLCAKWLVREKQPTSSSYSKSGELVTRREKSPGEPHRIEQLLVSSGLCHLSQRFL